jgi:acyl carrier protein
MSTLQRIKKLFLEKLEFPEDKISPEATIESLGLDSLDRIEFMFELENEFKIKIPERDVKIDSIQDMCDVIEKLVAQQHGAELNKINGK